MRIKQYLDRITTCILNVSFILPFTLIIDPFAHQYHIKWENSTLITEKGINIK